MSLKAHQLNAAYARRREIEQQRVERTAAVSRYYDHWGKVTSRFGTWTNPEYYQQAEEQLKQSKEKKDKEDQLEMRRHRLGELFRKEKALLDLEMKQFENPRSRKHPVDTETLEKIDKTAKEREQMKRKLELEAKLYGRLRHGVDDENLLFDSKSDHKVLAKLNWLDKQVEDQMAREKEEAISQERNLRLQEEISKTELLQKERQEIREQEIKEIRALQDRHMDQLKERQRESDLLREEEAEVRTHLKDLEKELDLLIDSSAVVLERDDISQAYNLKKIKVFIRKRSETFRNQTKLIISLLERIKAYVSNGTEIDELLSNYNEQLEIDDLTISQIETMYESEAKSNLSRLEECWQAQHLERYHDVQQVLKEAQCALSTRLNGNLQKQQDLLELRATHLSSIESSNEKLKQLMKEEEDSPRAKVDEISLDEGEYESATALDTIAARGNASSSTAVPFYPNLPKVTNSFTNLNLDGWKELTSARGDKDSPRLQSQRSLQVVALDKAERPKYARKRVAWT